MPCLPSIPVKIKTLGEIPMIYTKNMRPFAKGADAEIFYVKLSNCTSNKTYVFRRTIHSVKGHSMKQNFIAEYNLTLKLANLKVAPKIYYYGIDEYNHGVFLMNKLEQPHNCGIPRELYETQIKSLFYTLGRNERFCTDVKMENTLVSHNGSYVCKLIDFSSDWCFQHVKRDPSVLENAMMLLFSVNTELSDKRRRVKAFAGPPLFYNYINKWTPTTKMNVFNFLNTKKYGLNGALIVVDHYAERSRNISLVNFKETLDPSYIYEFIVSTKFHQ